jgi:hypothetical protein
MSREYFVPLYCPSLSRGSIFGPSVLLPPSGRVIFTVTSEFDVPLSLKASFGFTMLSFKNAENRIELTTEPFFAA